MNEKEQLLEYKKQLSNLTNFERKYRDLYLRKLALGEILGPPTGLASIDKPWLKYFNEITIMSDIPKMNIYEFLLLGNLNNYNSVAINYAFVNITYKKLFQKIEDVADSLYALGIRQGDVIASCLPNVPEAIYLIYAAAKIGATIDLIDALSSKELLAKYCDNSKPKLLFSLDVMSENAIKNLDVCSYEKVITLSPVESLPILNWSNKTSKGIHYSDNIISWKNFLRMGKNVKSEWCTYVADMPFAILHTGGTTGIPKSALLSHDNMNSLAHQFINSPLEMKAKETVLNLMPPFASYGLGNGIHVHLSCGMKLVLIPTYDPSKIEEQLLKYKPNRIACSPAHYEYIKNSEKLKNSDLSFLRHPIEGGDSLNTKTEQEVNELFLNSGCKDKVAKGYGLTESCSGVCVCVNNEVNKIGSVGIPLSKNIISIFDPDNKDKELSYDTYGEIAILSPNNMLCYNKMPDETKNTLKEHSDGTTWLHTGDFGKIDKDGNLFISGRMRRMIIQFSGLKSNPFEVEEQLLKHPLVKNAIVVGAKDPNHEQGELPVAYILVDTKDLDKEEQLREELHNICTSHVTYYSVPVDYVFVDEYPRTPIAKIDFKKMSLDYNNMILTRKLIPQKQLKI